MDKRQIKANGDWVKMHDKNRIIAVDFDGTLCKKAVYPHIGAPNNFLIEKLIKMQSDGWKVILHTCREGESLLQAVAFCEKKGLFFDAVNEDIKAWDSKQRIGRKIYADIYIDDKAVNPLPFNEIPYVLLPQIWHPGKSLCGQKN